MSDETEARWAIVNGWLVEELPEELQRDASPFTGPEEHYEPLVELATLPGYSELLGSIPALASGELFRLAKTLEQMPAPRGDQPREFDLSVRVPRLGVEVSIGVCRWNPRILEWTWQASLPTKRDEATLDYPFRDDQDAPAGTVERRRP